MFFKKKVEDSNVRAVYHYDDYLRGRCPIEGCKNCKLCINLNKREDMRYLIEGIKTHSQVWNDALAHLLMYDTVFVTNLEQSGVGKKATFLIQGWLRKYNRVLDFSIEYNRKLESVEINIFGGEHG